jgi:hypothetical protein
MKMLKSYSEKFYYSVGKRSENSADEILDVLLIHLGKSQIGKVTDLGCGAGAWTEKLLTKTNSQISCLDLRESIKLCQSKFTYPSSNRLSYYAVDFEVDEIPLIDSDLVLNLEVLEHLSLETGRKLISWMSSNSRYVLFSAAIPGQGGTGHINEKPHNFWLKEFQKLGFIACDIIRPLIQHSDKSARYYQLNTFLLVNVRLVLVDEERDKWQNLALDLRHPVKDYRSKKEKLQYRIISVLSPRFVTFLSKYFSH